MRTVICTLAIVLAVHAAPAADVKHKPDPDRLKGMKAAIADVEKGVLKLIVLPTPAPLWELEYHKLLQKECGVEVTTAGFSPAEGGEKANKGYDDVMTAEIEHRFGAGVLAKLQTRAEVNLREDGKTPPPLLPLELSTKAKVLKQWNAWSPFAKDNDKWKLVPEGGLITSQKDWAKLWKEWYGEEEVPVVDFDKEVILVAAGGGPNTIKHAGPSLSDAGDLTFGCSITERGGDGFVGVILKVSRAGVKTVGGKELPKE